MKKASYKDRDYAFGQLMLRLRTTINLTQAGLAEQLGVSRHEAETNAFHVRGSFFSHPFWDESGNREFIFMPFTHQGSPFWGHQKRGG